jgi:aspartyl-tRNA synthetase
MCGPAAPAEKSEEEKAKIKAEREARKAAEEEKQRVRKAEKEAKAKAEAEAAAAALAELRKPVSYSTPQLPDRMVGDYEIMQSRGTTGRTWADMSKLGEVGGAQAGEVVWVRARVANVRAKGGSCFLVLRDMAAPSTTVQACLFKSKEDPEGSKTTIKFMQDLTLETIVDIQGTLAAAEVRTCSQGKIELQVMRCYVVSRSPAILPFLLEDAARSDEEIAASQSSDKPLAAVYQENRLDNRWLDLRVPANNAMMRLQSAVCQLFRESLYAQGFIEIHTPKLIAGESEGGSEVFRTDYFGTSACLAQSPQLYKQMAISADLNRVFEIGPVFRAEKSNTRRHLCEFTGLDIEMAIKEHYNEALEVLHTMFKHIFNGMEERYSVELAVVRQQYASQPVRFTDKPCIVHWDEGMKMLQDAGEAPDVLGDLSGAHELKLGELVAQKYGADFWMLDRYPAAARPFYTMPYPEDDRYTNSYDIFIRGQEIASGAQRVHDPALLRTNIALKGMPVEPLKDYVTSFEHAAPPHAGAGIGLERVLFLYLGLDNVRKASMFPRDPNRISP